MTPFPTTHWSLLAQATLHGDTRSQQALADFCRRYRQPVVEFFRWRGVAEVRVEDVAHDFLVQLLTHSSLRRADPMKGRFRTFLCGAMRHFLSDDRDRRLAQKRGSGVELLSLNGHGQIQGHGHGSVLELAAVADEGVKDQLFLDRAWALHVIERAVEAVAGEWAEAGKAERFGVLRAFLPGAVDAAEYGAAGERLGMSAVAVRSEVSRLRSRFRWRLRGEVAATVSAPEEVEDELRHLCAVFVRVVDPPPAPLAPQLPRKS